jgi:hypothetical protein
MRVFCTFSSPVQQPSLYGVVWPDQLELPLTLALSLNFSGGFLIFFLLVKMFKLQGWQQFAGPFGSYGIERVLKAKIIQNPTELICFAVVFMKYWAGLNMQADGDALWQGADALQGVAPGMVQPSSTTRLAIADSRRIGDTGEVDDNSDADGARGEKLNLFWEARIVGVYIWCFWSAFVS